MWLGKYESLCDGGKHSVSFVSGVELHLLCGLVVPLVMLISALECSSDHSSKVVIVSYIMTFLMQYFHSFIRSYLCRE